MSKISTSGRVVKRARACQVRAKIRAQVRANIRTQIRAKIRAKSPCRDFQCPCRFSSGTYSNLQYIDSIYYSSQFIDSDIAKKTAFEARQKTNRDHSKVDYQIQKNFDKIKKLEKQVPAENRPEKPVYLLHEFMDWSDRLNLKQKSRLQTLQNDYLIDLSVYEEYFENEKLFAEMACEKTSDTVETPEISETLEISETSDASRPRQ